MGILYRIQGRLAEAESMYQRAQSGFQAALGPSHWKSKAVELNLESLRRAKGNPTTQ